MMIRDMPNLFLFLILSALTVFIPIGCGNGDGSGGGDDTGNTAYTPSTYILSSNPANGAKNVSPIQEITITFSEKMDTGTINRDNITLNANSGFGIFYPSCTLAYDDATNTVTVKRSLQLNFDEDTYPVGSLFFPCAFFYQVSISNVKTLSGIMVEATSINFSSFRYTRKVDHDQFDNITGYMFHRYDSSGVLEREVSYIDAGDDGTWFTEDDTPEKYCHYTLDSFGRTTREVFYNGPGPDTVWITSDDDLYYYNDYSYNSSGSVSQALTFYEIGSDGIWFSPDDIDYVYYHQSAEYDADNRIEQLILYRYSSSYDKGPDNIPLTADDIPNQYDKYFYSPEGPLAKRITFGNPGDDETWLTDDDVISTYRTCIRDANSYKIQDISAGNSGPDEVWNTDDDDIRDYINYTRDVNGNLTMEIEYEDEGSDGIWFTEDDTFDEYTEYEYDERGLLIRKMLYTSPGVDGAWFTADDLYVSYSTYDVDED